MWQKSVKTFLMAKSVVGLGFAYEIATAGQMVAGVCVATVGCIPMLWNYSRKLIERDDRLP